MATYCTKLSHPFQETVIIPSFTTKNCLKSIALDTVVKWMEPLVLATVTGEQSAAMLATVRLYVGSLELNVIDSMLICSQRQC